MESEIISKLEIERFCKDLITNLILEFNFEEDYDKINSEINSLNHTDSINSNDSIELEIQKYFQHIQFRDKYSITMIKTKEQHGGALCGFFSLFNILNFLQFLKNRNDQCKQLYYLRKTNSTSQFWLFYKETLKFLLDSMFINKTDKSNLLELGPLERYQFMHLLECKVDIRKIIADDEQHQIKFFNYFYGFNFVQSMSKQQIKDLQTALEWFKNYKKEKILVYVIILGITDHWSVLILENKKGQIRNYYLDSNNENVFHLNPFDVFEMEPQIEILQKIKNFSENESKIEIKEKLLSDLNKKNEQIERYAEEYCEEIQKFRNKPISPWFKRCYIQWIIDINIVLKDIFKILFENFSIYDVVMNSMILRLTRTFEEYISCELDCLFPDFESSLKDEEIFIMKEKMLQWLTIEYHPQVLKVDVLNSFEAYSDSFDFKNLVVFKKFKNWVKFSKNMKSYIYDEDYLFITDPEERDRAELISRFYEVLQKLENFL